MNYINFVGMNGKTDLHKQIQRYLLFTSVFVCGTVVMIIEIAAARLLAPITGTSHYVWTSLITLILLSLSTGNWFGGKISDINPTIKKFTFCIIAAAFSIGCISLFSHFIFSIFHQTSLNHKWKALFLSGILFVLPPFFLGAIPPYAIKLATQNIQKSKKTIGDIYALSTLGSILGVFFTGYIFIPYFSVQYIFYVCFVMLLIISGFLLISTSKIIVRN